MQIYLPWGVYALGLAAAFFFVRILPEMFLRRRAFGRGPELRWWWLGLVAVAVLIAWPLVAAGAIKWRNAAPSMLSVFLMTFAAGGAGWVIQWLADQVLGAVAQGFRASQDGEAPSAGDVDLLRFTILVHRGSLVAVLLFAAAAFLLLTYGAQSALCGDAWRCRY